MKTQVVMIRRIGNIDVFQRTKDGMFNATNLLKQWNETPGNPKRKLDRFWELKQTKEFLVELEKDDEFLNTSKKGYLKKRGKYGGTWMHSYLFLKFAMWLNPKFEYQVIKFVHDQLIEYRELAGDLYKDLTNAVSQLDNVNYGQMAKGLNYIVFGKHEKGIRQRATKKELKTMNDLQKKLAFAIDMGYIKDFDSLINEMRKMFNMAQFGKLNLK